MEQVFLGSAQQRILFTLHAPQPPALGAQAADGPPPTLVICPPLGLEYMRSQRCLRQLAINLSRAGWAVARFDYFATGDSYGEDGQLGLESISQDLGLVIEELERRQYLVNHQAPYVLGVRQGAWFAAWQQLQRACFAALLLWDMPFDAAAWCQAAINLPTSDGQALHWLDGYGYSADFIRQLAALSADKRLLNDLQAPALLVLSDAGLVTAWSEADFGVAQARSSSRLASAVPICGAKSLSPDFQAIAQIGDFSWSAVDPLGGLIYPVSLMKQMQRWLTAFAQPVRGLDV